MPMHRLLFAQTTFQTLNRKDNSLQCLTACCLAVTGTGSKDTAPDHKSLKLALDLLIRNCSTLVDFAMIITPHVLSPYTFTYGHLLENATWPSLERLTLTGPLILFDKVSPETKASIAASFFWRHPLLRCLRLQDLSDPIEPYLTKQDLPLPAILPSLKSFFSDYPVDPSLLLRLTHLSTTRHCPIDSFTSAPLLRSCVIFAGSPNGFQEFVESVLPENVERLSLYYPFLPDEDDCDDCESRGPIDFSNALDGIPSMIEKLHKLTHLHIYMEEACGYAIGELIRHLAVELPSLSFGRMWSNYVEDEWFHYHDKDENGQYEEEEVDVDWEAESGPGSWGEFYTGDECLD